MSERFFIFEGGKVCKVLMLITLSNFDQNIKCSGIH